MVIKPPPTAFSKRALLPIETSIPPLFNSPTPYRLMIQVHIPAHCIFYRFGALRLSESLFFITRQLQQTACDENTNQINKNPHREIPNTYNFIYKRPVR